MSLKTYMYEKFTDLSNLVNNPLATTKFLAEGVLTPEEFVLAGDLLVAKCPSWSWQTGNPKSLQKGMPPNKQYLLTKNVPCFMRVSALESKSNYVENKEVNIDGDGEESWLATHTNEPVQKDEDIPEIPSEVEASEDSDGDVPEINLDDLSVQETEEDPATLAVDNVERSRTYDLSICYDQYHQTPRVWLFGYDESKKPLKPEQVLEDISQDHAKKTVTIATHPHQGLAQAYIHPCKHAEVMKKIIQRITDSGKEPRVDQYMLIFLKFIHAAIPTIEYDYTMEMAM